MKKYVLKSRTLMVASLLILLSGWLSPVAFAAPPPTVIRLAAPDNGLGGKEHFNGGVADVLVWRQLLEKEFQEDGIKVEWQFFKAAGPAINEALANKQVDFAFYGDLPAIIGKANGLDITLLAATGRQGNAYLGVRQGLDVKSLQDLKGKTLAVFRGTIFHLSLVNALASVGMTERDLRVVNMDLAASTAALSTGRVDAVWGSSNLYELQDKGLAYVALSSGDLGGVGGVQSVLVGSKEFLASYPDITRRLLRVLAGAYDWISVPSNRQVYLGEAARRSGFTQEQVDRAMGTLSFGDILQPDLDAPFIESLDKQVSLAKEMRLIRKSFNAADWADTRPLLEAKALPSADIVKAISQ
ncbi:ABC transporter substrate-binding protein [Pseudomonas amygdali]|uniref:ABC transporter substrate-binding protein n=2 Tax=Pseudomonas amygdali TaxID=47877 RepID=UPI000E3D79A8|nr:ABC transporter substrate-binding protein [Pseudomonas amygdali]